MLDSYTSLQMGPRGSADTGALSHRGGMTRALVESHIPFDVISEHNASPDVLNQYRVVILANTTCLSDRLVKTLRAYVASGGGLMATYESSLYDERGKARSDFALADLFGALYAGKTKTAGPSRIGFASASNPVTDDALLRGLMGERGNTTYWGRFARVIVAPSHDVNSISPLSGTEVLEAGKDSPTRWTPLLHTEARARPSCLFPGGH